MLSEKEIIDSIIKLGDSILEVSKIKGDSVASVNIDNERGIGIELNEQESMLFSKIVEYLCKRQEVSERYSESKLRNILWNFLFDIVENQEIYAYSKNDKARDFIKSLIVPPIEWVVLMPIDELNSELKEFSIGDVFFSVFNRSDINEWKILSLSDEAQLKSRYARYKEMEFGKVVNGVSQSIPHMDFEEYKKLEIERTERDQVNFIDKICARVKVNAVDADKAIEIAKFKINTTLNLMSLYYGIRGFKPIITIKEPLTVITQSSKGEGLLHLERDWSWGVAIKLEQKDDLVKHFKNFEKILCESKKSKLCNGIIRSIRWCGRAINDTTLEDKLVWYFTALECILSTKDEGEGGRKGEIIGIRVGILLTNSKEHRKQISDDVCRLYEIRSNIVHGSRYEIKKEDIGRIDFVTRNVICVVTRVIQENGFVKINQLLKWIDKQ